MLKKNLFCLFFSFTSLLSASTSKEPDFTHFAKINDPVLNQKAKCIDPLTICSPEIQSVIQEMLDISRIYRDARSSMFMVGLAAPQIGVSKRIILVDLYTDRQKKDTAHDLKIYINPEIIWKSEEIIDETFEGCFSAGNVSGIVPRYQEIIVRALDEKGNIVEERFDGFTARIFQHEIDHLDGIRFPDRIQNETHLHWVEDEEKDDYRKEFKHWKRVVSKEKWQRLSGKAEA